MSRPRPDFLSVGSIMDIHCASIAEDTALLGSWASAFELICGQPVHLNLLDAADASGGLQMSFPSVFQPINLIGSTGHFRGRPALVEHIRRMGFDWNEEGRVMTVPAPGAFNARLATVGLPESGFYLSYANEPAPTPPLGSWLLCYLRGVITLLVYAPEFYERLLRPECPLHLRYDARWGLMSLAHDLSIHALNYHLVPHVALADLAERIRAALPERHAAWSQAGTVTPLTLTYFYDNDFNRYTYAVWCLCERPQDFGSIFVAKRNFAQLVDALDVRLAETAAGRGDVPSGDFDEVGKLAETSFDLR